VKRGRGRVQWVVGRASSQILAASFAKSPDDAAQPATGEPYTILIMIRECPFIEIYFFEKFEKF
jgi:hypothetical protein